MLGPRLGGADDLQVPARDGLVGCDVIELAELISEQTIDPGLRIRVKPTSKSRFDHQARNLVDHGLSAILEADCVRVVAGKNRTKNLVQQDFERADQAADFLGRALHGASRRLAQATPRMLCCTPGASWLRSISDQPSRKVRTRRSTSITGATCFFKLASSKRRR